MGFWYETLGDSMHTKQKVIDELYGTEVEYVYGEDLSREEREQYELHKHDSDHDLKKAGVDVAKPGTYAVAAILTDIPNTIEANVGEAYYNPKFYWFGDGLASIT